jgi:predicted nucleic acid-binding protein
MPAVSILTRHVPPPTGCVNYGRENDLGRRYLHRILIGAYATNRRGLITRNPADFRRNFPDLQILEP